jgi:hypothetical protein
MNSPPLHIRWLQRLVQSLRVIILLVISVAAGYFVWDRLIPPTWVYTPPTGGVNLIGITQDGRVVTIDSRPGETVQGRLHVHAIDSGKIIFDFAIPSDKSLNNEGVRIQFHHGVVSGDGEIAILISSKRDRGLFVNLRSGELLPSPPWGILSADACSPDGRYVVLNVKHEDESKSQWRLYDLKAGQLSWDCERTTHFSPDSQSFLCYKYDRAQRSVTIRSVCDNTIVLSDEVPRDMNAEFLDWSGDRLFVTHSSRDSGSQLSEVICSSFATTGTRLSDERREPLIGGSLINPKCYSFRYFSPFRRGEKRIYYPPDEDSLIQRMNASLEEWGIPFDSMESKASWQPYSSEDAKPFGVRIGGLSRHFKISPQGDWLVEYGDHLRVWKLPAHRSWARWCYVFLAAAAPWGLWWILRRRTKALKARQPDTPEDAA